MPDLTPSSHVLFNFKQTHFIPARPKFVKTPRNLEVGVEDNVTINCDALGQPEPKVEWFINGIPIKGQYIMLCVYFDQSHF